MENNEQITGSEIIAPKLELTENSINSLKIIRKWTMFFSVLGFILVGIIIIITFVFIAISNKEVIGNLYGGIFPSSAIFFIYLLFAVLYFFPAYFLYKFSSYSKKAFNTNTTFDLDHAFKNLKFHFSYVGILTIVMIAIYILLILFVVFIGYKMGKI